MYLFCTYPIDFVRFWSVWSFRIIGSSCRSGGRDGSSPPFRTTRLARYAGSFVAGPLTRATRRMRGDLPHGET
jgi:hypothetical protein